MRRGCEISGVSSLFGHPVVAAALGVLLGAALTVSSERAASFVTPQNPFHGMVVVIAMMLLRFALSVAALAAFFFFAREGLVAFGVALAVSFITGLVFEAVKVSRLDARHTSA